MTGEERKEVAKEAAGVMGLRGVWAQVANFGAVLLICILFYQGQVSDREEASRDRQMFVNEMRDLTVRGMRQDDALAEQKTIVLQSQEMIRANQELLRQTAEALREVARELSRSRSKDGCS